MPLGVQGVPLPQSTGLPLSNGSMPPDSMEGGQPSQAWMDAFLDPGSDDTGAQ